MRKYSETLENIFGLKDDSMRLEKMRIKERLSKVVIPSIVSSLQNPEKAKKLSTEWKKILLLNYFVVIINSDYHDQVTQVLSQNSLFVKEFFFNSNLVSKEYLTKLEK